MPIFGSISSDEAVLMEDEAEEAKMSPYFEHFAVTAEGEISSETILNVCRFLKESR
jgi:predicted nucleic-acid-binding protein